MSRTAHPLLALLGLAAAAALGAPAAALADIDPTVFEVAGTGQEGFAGDGGAAQTALLNKPRDTAPLPDGGFLIADRDNQRVRRVLPDGRILTVAGGGGCGGPPCGDQGQATSADLAGPTGVSTFPDGSFLIADANDHRVRRVSPSGTITVAAGTGGRGAAGDGGAAINAQLATPREVSALPDGGFLIADTDNNRIRRVLPDGRVATVAGTGGPGLSGDGGSAVSAQLAAPFDVDAADDGGYLIADTGNNRIRRVSPTGIITTVAGAGTAAGFAGDGRPAIRAVLNGPVGVEALPSGGFLVADTQNDRVRRVSPGGTISTEAGTSTGFASGPGSRARLDTPQSVMVRGNGQVLVSDLGNARVRGLSQTGEPSPPVLRTSVVLDPVEGQTRFRPRGAGGFLALTVDENIPAGSTIDASASEVQVSVQASIRGDLDRVMLSQGPFVVRQLTGDQPITELELKDPPPRCPTASSKRKARAAAPSPDELGRAAGGAVPGGGPLARAPGVRRGSAFRGAPLARAAARRRSRVFARGRGRFRTRGRYGSGTKRGTEFLTEDRCDGTLFKVREGQIAVRDFVRGKTIIVKAGQRYFARAGKRRR